MIEVKAMKKKSEKNIKISPIADTVSRFNIEFMFNSRYVRSEHVPDCREGVKKLYARATAVKFMIDDRNPEEDVYVSDPFELEKILKELDDNGLLEKYKARMIEGGEYGDRVYIQWCFEVCYYLGKEEGKLLDKEKPIKTITIRHHYDINPDYLTDSYGLYVEIIKGKGYSKHGTRQAIELPEIECKRKPRGLFRK